MKKITFLTLAIGLLTASLKAQDIGNPTNKEHELKFNTFSSIAFKALDLSYEHLLNEESSIGASFFYNFGDDKEFLSGSMRFSGTLYYRRYFSKSHAKGFFVEGFSMLNSGPDQYFFNELGILTPLSGSSYTDIALGISLGVKLVSKRGFTLEIFAGLGRNLLGGTSSPDFVGRAGISIGYRF